MPLYLNNYLIKKLFNKKYNIYSKMNAEKIKGNKNNDSIPSYIVEAITSLNPEPFLKSESSPSYPIETFNISEKLDSSKKEKEKEKEYKIGNYLIKKTLGQGTFGKVKLAIYLPTDEKVAIKILEKDRIVEKDDEIRLKREFDMLALFNHPNVILVAEIFESTDRYYSVMEFCEGGELFNYIVKKRKLSEDESAFFYYQLINGLEYIHSLGIVHRDLKPENLLLTKSHILKIIDFGLSNYFKNDQEDLLETPCGSPCYASPEMVAGKKYNGFKIDIWSSGIILFAMLCGYLPFEDKDNDILFEKILECKLSFPKYISRMAKDLIEKILVTDPEKRININDIKKHPFFIKGKTIFESEFKIIKNKKISSNDASNKKNNNEDIVDKEKNREQCDIKEKKEVKNEEKEKKSDINKDDKNSLVHENKAGKENKAINIEENEVVLDINKEKEEKMPHKEIIREKIGIKENDKKLEEKNKNNNKQIPISNLEQGNINHHLHIENDRNNQNLHKIKNPIISDIMKDKNISGVNGPKNNPKNVIHRKAYFVKNKEINSKNNNDYLANKLDKNNINSNVRTRSRDYRNNKKQIQTINFHNFKLNYAPKTNFDISPKIKTTKHNNKNIIRKRINYTNIIKQNFNSKDSLDFKSSNKKGNIYINNINNTIDNEQLPYKMRINYNFKETNHNSKKDTKRAKSNNKNNIKMNSFETSIKKDKKYLDNLISINSNIKKYEKKLNFGEMDNKNEDRRHKNKIKEINIHYNNKTLELNEDNNLKRYKENLVKTEKNKEGQKRRNSRIQNISTNNLDNENIKIIENVNNHQYVKSSNMKQNLRKIINDQKRIEKEDSKINNDNNKRSTEKPRYSHLKKDNLNNNTIENINISNILNKNHIQKKTIDASSNKRHKINTDILSNVGYIKAINTYNDNTEHYTRKTVNSRESKRNHSKKRDQIPIDIANHLNRKRIFKDIYISNNNSSLNTIENITKTEHKKKIDPKRKNFDLIINENSIKNTRKNIIHIKLNSINTKTSRHLNQKMIFNYNKKQSSIISNNSKILNQTNNSNANNTSIKNPFLNTSNYLDSLNPSVNSNNISSNGQNINYINRRYKNSQTITYNSKRKKPYVTIRNTVINFNMIDTGIFLSSLNKKDSKRPSEIAGTKNPVSTISGNRMHNNRLYGLCSKYSNGNTNISINNKSIDQFSRTRNIRVGHNDLNYKRIIQKIERNNNTKSYIKIEDKNSKNKYKGNYDKTHIKYNSMKSEDFYFLKGGKKIKNLNIDNNLLNSVDGSDKFNGVKQGHFNTSNNE